MSDRVGQQLGHYRLLRLVGSGGFAEVYLGTHIHLGTQAAIKLLHTQLASEKEVEQFRAEARIIAALVHPHIVRVLDFGLEGSAPYLVMDYAPNGNLRQRLPQGVPLAPLSILPYVRQIAEALQYAHQQRLVHRDIKPENMLLGRNHEVLLSDFGIATVFQSTSQQQSIQAISGTVAYMAPEQLQGYPRPASDQYSLGIVVYEWLTGQRPFQGTFLEIASQHALKPPPSLRQYVPTLSPLLEQIVLTALAKDPKARFATPPAFATALEEACRSSATPSFIAPSATTSPHSPSIAAPSPPTQLPGSLPQQSEASVFFSPTQVTPTVPGAMAPITAPPASAEPQSQRPERGWPQGSRQDNALPLMPSPPPRPRRLRTAALISMLILVLVASGSAWVWFARPSFLFHTGPVVRGSIYDRNGVLLAYSEQDPNVSGGYRRRYCFPSLSPLIGYISAAHGKSGLEAAYDDYLTGQKGVGTSSINTFWDQLLHRPVYGADLYLTIDWRVQNLIDKQNDITYDEPGGVLGEPIFPLARGTTGVDPKTRPSRCDPTLTSQIYTPPAEGADHSHAGSIIVEDPHTGEILGMLSRPYFDADKITDPATGEAYFQQLKHDSQYAPLLTRPTNGLYVPGSTFKTATLSAALDTGKYQLSNQFGGNSCLAQDSEARSYTVNGHTFHDLDLLTYNPVPSCPIDLKHGYIYSDNIIYARVGVGLGADTWLNYVQRFGIVNTGGTQALPFDLSVTPSTVDFQGVHSDPVNLAADAFGQGALQVTPLTMTLITSTVANDGVAMLPHLLSKVVPHGANPNDPNAITQIAPTTYGTGPIMSAAAAQGVRESMRGVVQQGSAGLISRSLANVGGKTGTGQTDNADPHSWFISMAPDNPGQTPKWVIVVMKENGDEGLFQAPVADCIYLNMPGQAPMQNVDAGNFYPRYNCAP